MINQSKADDERFWKKWGESGAVASVSSAADLKLESPLSVTHICELYVGRYAGKSVLGLGEKVINSGPNWRVYAPVMHCISPGHERYYIGQRLSRLPEGSVRMQDD
ncbi:hypothetical protein KY359_00225 [Candidatus Woesearchaeota archaeon]|nr:hypothetical protein [Candidatus Woesearchaeota archaeon]